MLFDRTVFEHNLTLFEIRCRDITIEDDHTGNYVYYLVSLEYMIINTSYVYIPVEMGRENFL